MNHGGKVFGTYCACGGRMLSQSCPESCIQLCGSHSGLEPIQYRRRRASQSVKTIPIYSPDIRQAGFSHRWYVWKKSGSLRSCNGERGERTSVHERSQRRNIAENCVDLAAEHILKGLAGASIRNMNNLYAGFSRQ